MSKIEEVFLKVVAYFLLCLVTVGFGLAVLISSAFPRPGYWVSSGDPEVDKWFHDQRTPNGRARCCDISDGDFVEEEIREGHYWVKWEKSQGQWIPVPDEVVINNQPNKWGRPAVWWGLDEDGQSIYIRCYVPGAKS